MLAFFFEGFECEGEAAILIIAPLIFVLDFLYLETNSLNLVRPRISLSFKVSI